MKTRTFALALTVAAALAAPAAASAAPQYVALGDSYTAVGSFLSPASGAPFECGQSAVNYPHLVAEALGLSLTDMSCGGATTANMTTAQYPNQPAQFSALSASTKIVTISISGNDNEVFAQAIGECGALDIADALNIGSPCESTFGDYYSNLITSDAPTVGGAIAEIHTLAPNAKVFVVGYPDILPQSGNCYPQVPLTTGDTAYMNATEEDVNRVLANEAAANDATFINTYGPSIGHDACQPENVRWIEGPIPATDTAPMHPNAAGEAADAKDVEAAMTAAGIS